MNPAFSEEIRLIDCHPATDTFFDDVCDGLQQQQKSIPSKYFYDARGSQLFEAITELPEYYPTRTEIGILRRYLDEIVVRVGRRSLLVEYGSGSSLKTRILLDALPQAAGYVPIDISRDHLLASARQLAERYPDVPIIPVCADYTTDFQLPDLNSARPVVFFPGSTIGNFRPHEARAFLHHMAQVVGPGGGLLIGVDLMKDPAIIEAAYNDAQGVTAAFNKNMLVRINRELQGTFDLDQFEHLAFYNSSQGRIEMHLRSLSSHQVRIGDLRIRFTEGETILTEYSYKYSLDDFAALANDAGFVVEQAWTDAADLFSVQSLIARG